MKNRVFTPVVMRMLFEPEEVEAARQAFERHLKTHPDSAFNNWQDWLKSRAFCFCLEDLERERRRSRGERAVSHE